MAALAARFRAEAATQPSHPLAGKYYEGDGLGMNVGLDLSPSGQYALTWHGCMGLYHHEAGTYTFDDKSVTLTPTDHPDPGLRKHRDLLRVAWGRRAYLVPRAEAQRFLRDINRGEEPRVGLQGTGLMRDGDHRLPAPGDPALPDELKAGLRPVFSAAILRVDELRDMPWMKPRMVTGAVTLNVGKKQRVSAGQIFRAPDDRPPFSIRVTKLADDTAEGEYYGPADVTVSAGDEVIGRAPEQ